MNQEDNVNIKAYFCILASENYKKAGEKSKAETILKEYEKFTPDFEYFKHSEKIENYSETIDQVYDYADSIVENSSSYEILEYLMKNPELTSHYENSFDFVEKSKRNSPLLHACSKLLHDENGFVIKKNRIG